QPVRVLLLCCLRADPQMAEPLSGYSLAYWLPAPACSLHYQPGSGVSSLGFGPLFLRAGAAGFLCPSCTDLRLKAAWPKISKLRHISLHQAPAVPEPWAFGFRPLHDVAAHDHLPLFCGDAVCLLLPGARRGATNAGDRSQLCRLHGSHWHVPPRQPWRPSLPVVIWKFGRAEICSAARTYELARAGSAGGVRLACLHRAAYRSHRRVTERGSRLGLSQDSRGDAGTILLGAVRSLSSRGLAAGGERYLCRTSSATRLWDDRNVCRCWHWPHGAWECSLVTFQVSVRMAAAVSRLARADRPHGVRWTGIPGCFFPRGWSPRTTRPRCPAI